MPFYASLAPKGLLLTLVGVGTPTYTLRKKFFFQDSDGKFESSRLRQKACRFDSGLGHQIGGADVRQVADLWRENLSIRRLYSERESRQTAKPYLY